MTPEADRRTPLALVGSTLLFAQILLFEPIDIWARNAGFMVYSGFLHAAALAAGLIIAVLATMTVWRVLPSQLKTWAASLMAAAGILAWTYAKFLFVDGFQLNGRESVLTFGTSFGALELAIVAAGTAVLAALIVHRPREAVAAVIALLVAQSAFAGYQLLSKRQFGEGLRSPNLDALWRASRTGAVYVFILDTLQADVTREVFSKNPALVARFDGFKMFVNATGVAPTTYPSLPAIHSGASWDPALSLLSQYEAYVKRGSFLAQLGRSGYETSHINVVYGFCAAETAVCASTLAVIGRRGIGFLTETLNLLDLSLLRAAPHYWKNAIFSDGTLWLSRWIGGAFLSSFADRDIEMLDIMERRTVTVDGPKTAKVIHLLSTHPSFTMKEDCKSYGSERVDGASIAAVCTLNRIAGILSGLKAGGAFNDALIIVMADHGGMRPLSPTARMSPALGLLASHANPTLMVKLPGATAKLEESTADVSIVDVAVTVCEVVRSCSATGGVSLQRAGGGVQGKRRRVYHHYVWKNEYWTLARIPNVATYEIIGAVGEQSSWRKRGPAPRFELGETIDFRATASRDARGLGWSTPEPWGTWTEGNRATVRFALGGLLPRSLTLTARAHALVSSPGDPQLVDVTVNGRPLTKWTFDRVGPVDQTLRVPAEILDGSGIIEVDLDIERPRSPKELGINGDTRLLGIGLIEARVTAD